jgi:hypothetical protein
LLRSNSLCKGRRICGIVLGSILTDGDERRTIHMAISEGVRLSHLIRQKTEEFRAVCKGIDEKTASRAPEGRWSPKQIVSHLCGPEGLGYLPSMQAFLDQDTPRLDIKPEDPFFSEKRSRMTLSELLSEFEREYNRQIDFVKGLTEEQLARKAHIPLLKDTPLGEYLTLAQWIGAIADYHVGFHIDHLKEILQALTGR